MTGGRIVAFLAALLVSAGVPAAEIRVAAGTVDLGGRNYRITLDRRNGAIRQIYAGGRVLSLKNGRSGLWRATFDDGTTLDAADSDRIRCEIRKNRVRFLFEHVRFLVAVTIVPGEETVDFSAEISDPPKNLTGISVPGELLFQPEAVNRVICQVPRPNNVGSEFNARFFLPTSETGLAVWKNVRTAGDKPYIRLFGAPAKHLGDPDFSTLEYTPEAERLLGKNAVEEVRSFRTMPARPFGDGQADIKLGLKDGNVVFGGATFGGRGALYRMGGFSRHWGSIPAYLKMVEMLLTRVVTDSPRRKVGVLYLPYGVEGGQSPSAAQWKELVKRLPGEFVELSRSSEILHAVNSDEFALIVNPYGEQCPAPGKESLEEFTDRIRAYVKRGGIWFETEGYSFYYELKELPYLTTGRRGIPHGLADFFHLTLNGADLTLYGIQPLDYEPFSAENNPRNIYIPVVFELGGEKNGGFLKREWFTYIRPGERWTTPVTRLRFGLTPIPAMEKFCTENGINRKLADKLPPALLEKLTHSMLLLQWGASLRNMRERLAELPSPALLHTTQYLRGGFDKQYPDHLPPRPQWGSESEFREYIDEIHARGMLFMPYTNNTWWCDRPKGPTFQKYGDAPLQRDASGKLLNEAYGPNVGFMVSGFHPAVKAANAEIIRQFTQEYPADLIFQDQCGARGILNGERVTGLDFNPASPTPYAKIESLISSVKTDAAKAVLGTEEIWSGVVNEEVMACGMSFGLIPFNPYQVLLKEIYPPETWKVFPLAQCMASGRVLLGHHNLGANLQSSREISWTLALGFFMVRHLDSSRFTPADREFLLWLDRLQKSVVSRYAGQKLTAFSHEWSPSPAGREDDGVIRAVYGPVSIVANLTMKPLIEDSIRIAPGGFLARSDDGMIAGSDFVREGGKVWLFAPPGTIVSLPGTEGKSFKLDDGTILACRDGAFRLPAESGEYPRLWTGEFQ